MKVGWKKVSRVYRDTAETLLIILSVESPGEEKTEELGVVILEDGSEVGWAGPEVKRGGRTGGRH